MAEYAVEFEGLTELVNAFKKADRDLAKEIRGALKDAGEIVKVDAHYRAVDKIRNISKIGPGGPDWSQFRLGITGSNIVYIVPARHRKFARNRRPKFGDRLNKDVLGPAVEGNRVRVEHELIAAIKNVHQNAGLTRSLHKLGS